jgi:protein-S-isoprenylcysteine O-methyltransferase Ste14
MTAAAWKALYLGLLIAFVVIRRTARRQAGGGEGVLPLRERLLSGHVALATLLGAVLTLRAAPEAALPLPAAARAAGALVALGGLALLRQVHAALGAHFSPVLELKADHALVTTGPYARVRHPMYTAGLLFTAGHALVGGVLPALWPLAAVALLVALRLPDEEAMLEARFGEAFRAWRARTGRLLPGRGA